jgi:hypothetical protein
MHMSDGEPKTVRNGDPLEEIEKDHGVSSAADGDKQVPGLRRQTTQGSVNDGEEVLGARSHGGE